MDFPFWNWFGNSRKPFNGDEAGMLGEKANEEGFARVMGFDAHGSRFCVSICATLQRFPGGEFAGSFVMEWIDRGDGEAGAALADHHF